MKKAEELYMKHVYTTGGMEDQNDSYNSKEVMINEVERYIPTQRPRTDRNTSEIPPVRGSYGKTYPGRYENNTTGEISPNTQNNARYTASKGGLKTQAASQLPRGSYIDEDEGEDFKERTTTRITTRTWTLKTKHR